MTRHQLSGGDLKEDHMKYWPFEIKRNKSPGLDDWIKPLILGIIISLAVYYFIFSNAVKMLP
jgi:hypothetical protein